MKKIMLILSSMLIMFAVQSCEDNVNPEPGDATISIEELASDFATKSVSFKIKSNQPQVSFSLTGAAESSIPAEAYDQDKIYKINDLAEGDYTLTVKGYDAEGKESCNATANFSIKKASIIESLEINKDLTISIDKTSGKTGDIVKFSVMDAGNDVTGQVKICDADGFPVDSKYVIDFVGNQTFFAVRDNKRSANSVTITSEFDETEGYYKRNLILQFTSTSCGFCPLMDKALIELEQEYSNEGEPDRIGIIAVHSFGPSGDVFIAGDKDRTNIAQRLNSHFGITGYPTAVIDYGKTAGKIMSQLKLRCNESNKINPASVGIGIQTYVNEAGEVKIKANLRSNMDASYKLCCAYVLNNQKAGNTPYHHIATKYFTHELGENIEIPAKTYVAKEFTAKVDKDQLENCEIFVYVLSQRDNKFTVNNMNSVIAGKSVSTKLK